MVPTLLFAVKTVCIGTIAAIFGILLLYLCVRVFNYRPRWLFFWMVWLSVAMLVALPLGTPFGIVLLIILYLERHSFSK